MRLIDADALIFALETQDYSGSPESLEDWTPQDLTKVEIVDINNAPTIDAEPIKHGKWIKVENTSICSECGYAPISKIYFRGEKIWEISLIEEYHWCPCCGAKMDANEISNIEEDGKE